MPTNKQLQLNHTLTIRIIEMVIVTLICSIFIRPLLSELHPYFFGMQLVDLVLATLLYLVVRADILRKWEIAILLIISIFIILPPLMLSGGVNSQMAFLLPLYPMVAALIGTRNEYLSTGFFWVVVILLGAIFDQNMIDLHGYTYSSEDTFSRSFWLIISIIFSMFACRFFLQKYNKLTDLLKSENLLDPLTGLFNRRGLNLHFEHEFEKADINSPLIVILIDIDYFKKINDTYGHNVGDICLIEVAQTLKSTLRQHDIIARFGGEEFLVILPNTPKEIAITIAERLRLKVSRGAYSQFELPLTITLGITESSPENDTTLKMIKRADKALYRGKEEGRNRIEIAEN